MNKLKTKRMITANKLEEKITKKTMKKMSRRKAESNLFGAIIAANHQPH